MTADLAQVLQAKCYLGVILCIGDTLPELLVLKTAVIRQRHQFLDIINFTIDIQKPRQISKMDCKKLYHHGMPPNLDRK